MLIQLAQRQQDIRQRQGYLRVFQPQLTEVKGYLTQRKRRKFKAFLPLIIRGHVRSLVDKMDELGALMRTQQEYQAETWLQEQL